MICYLLKLINFMHKNWRDAEKRQQINISQTKCVCYKSFVGRSFL